MSTTPAAVAAVTYNIDPTHSSAHFKVRHLMISYVRGEFTKLSGTVTVDRENPRNSTVSVDIDAASISTRDPQRDAHLKSADFLDVEHHPLITFRSTKIEPKGHQHYEVTGNLTIRGTTREVALDVHGPTAEAKDPWGYLRCGAEAETKINRKDFGLTWNQLLETGGVAVGDEVQINIDVELVRPA